MIARVQILFTLALGACAMAWAAWFGRAGHPVAALCGAVALLLLYAPVLAVEFAALYFVPWADQALRPRAAEMLRAWWGEVVEAPAIFCWRQPFRSRAEADSLAVARTEALTGVVLVHGFMCNRGFWNPWMRELRARGVPFIAVDLEPAFGSIDRYVPTIEEAVAEMQRVTAAPVVIVGHSMGGLAIRAWLSEYRDLSRVKRIITIGTPHRGTWLARCSLAINGRQMRLQSVWLADLQAKESSEAHSRFTCFFSHCDNVVFPVATATLPLAKNLYLRATAHIVMAYRSEVFDEVWRWLMPGGGGSSATLPQDGTAPPSQPQKIRSVSRRCSASSSLRPEMRS